MKNINVWEKADGVFKAVQVAAQIAGVGMIVAADKVLSLVKRKKVMKRKKILK